MKKIDWIPTGLLDGINDATERDLLSNACDLVYNKITKLDDEKPLKIFVFPLIRGIFDRTEDKEDFDPEAIYDYCIVHLNSEEFAKTMGEIMHYPNIDAEAEYIAIITDLYFLKKER